MVVNTMQVIVSTIMQTFDNGSNLHTRNSIAKARHGTPDSLSSGSGAREALSTMPYMKIIMPLNMANWKPDYS